MAANVLIRKQKFSLLTSSEQEALTLRKLLNDTLQHDLTNILERVFEHHTSSDLYINIDKLHIDLGTIPAHDFEQVFIKLIEPKLIAELQKQLQEYMEPVSQAPQEYNFYDDAGSSASFLQLNSAAEQELAALIYFLEQGIFPWWYPKTDQKTPVEILGALTDDEINGLVLKIVSLNKKLSTEVLSRIVTRLYLYLPITKYTEIILSLAKLYSDASLLTNVKAVINDAGSLAIIFSLQERIVYQHLFNFLLQHRNLSEENFTKNLFRKIITKEGISIDDVKKNQNGKPVRDREMDQAFMDISNSLEIGLTPSTPAQKKNDNIKNPPVDQDQAGPDGTIYINNAGLLLLHPFLQYLFADAGLLTETNQFISTAEQHKASVLLYYLQSGQTEYKEWEMPLNKILCGLDHQTVLPGDITLSEDDKQNCDNLLKAAVNHWEALKGAGIDALRNTFLLREGKISRKENHWLIQAERTGTDILLDRLPWGFSTIKLSWLDQLIYTEW